MKSKIAALSAFAAIWVLSACGSRQVRSDESEAAKQDGVVKVWAAWVKDKGGKFDMNLNLKSEDEKKTILIYLSDISCGRGDLRGEVRHTFFNTGERNIQFAPGQHKSFNAVCLLPGKTKGEYSVRIGKVFDNPSGDGKTAGKVIGENLVWRQAD